MNMQMNSTGLGSLGGQGGSVDSVGMSASGMRTNLQDSSQSLKRKGMSSSSGPLGGSDINDPKKYDVLDTYEQASTNGNYKSLEYSIFNGGLDTGIEIGELSVINSSLLNHEVVDSVSGEKRSGFGAHSSL